ncbi:hypothetical protein Hanom_Chr16g01454371 [Helianthus anomalus]
MIMATKLKPQGPRFKSFEIWTKVAKVTKPQGPFWQFTIYIYTHTHTHTHTHTRLVI